MYRVSYRIIKFYATCFTLFKQLARKQGKIELWNYTAINLVQTFDGINQKHSLNPTTNMY